MKKHAVSTKKGITTITRGVVYAMAVGVFSVCAILFPELAREEAAGKAHPPTSWPFLVAAWVLSIPIFIALHQTLKLLKYIDEGTAFSKLSVNALQNIKICAVIFGLMIAASTITLVTVIKIANTGDDSPPFIMLGTVVTFTSCVIATFVAVLQRLLEDAINIKSENDLTV